MNKEFTVYIQNVNRECRERYYEEAEALVIDLETQDKSKLSLPISKSHIQVVMFLDSAPSATYGIELEEDHEAKFITNCLRVAGATSWEQLEGKTVRVRTGDLGVYAIGHIKHNDWVDLLAAQWEYDQERFSSDPDRPFDIDFGNATSNCLTCVKCHDIHTSTIARQKVGDTLWRAHCSVRAKAFLGDERIILTSKQEEYELRARGRAAWLPEGIKCSYYEQVDITFNWRQGVTW